MSTSLREVIESAGYDLSTREGAVWVKAQEDLFDELLHDADDTIDELDQAAIDNCEHDDTFIDKIEDTEAYEHNIAIGNLGAMLVYNEIEICNNCSKQRALPDGEWENM